MALVYSTATLAGTSSLTSIGRSRSKAPGLYKLPKNINFLTGINYRFVLKRAPHLTFFVQEALMPGLNLSATNIPNPNVRYPRAATAIEYEDLEIVFKIDEYLESWKEMHSWIRGLGFPYDSSEYAELENKPSWLGSGIDSDIVLDILTNTKNEGIKITFYDAWPTHLSGFRLRTNTDGVQYVDASVRFKYTYFDVSC